MDFTETQSFVIDVHGVVDVKAAEQAMRAEEEAARQARAANQLYADSLDDMGAKAQKARPHIDDFGRAVKSSGGGFGAWQQNVTAASYALQDFTSTSGDLGAKMNSVTNNLPLIFAGMGGLGIALSTVGTIATTVYRNWDSLTGLFETRNPFPAVAEDVGGLKTQLERAKEEMGKLTAAGGGTVAQLERYKALRADIADIEIRITKEKEKQATIDEMMKSRDKEEKDRGSAFDEASAGKVPGLQADIVAAMGKQGDQEIKRFKAASDERLTKLLTGGATNDELTKAAEVEKEAVASYARTVKGGLEDLAKQLLVDLHNGKADAVKKLRNLMDGGTGVLIGGNGFRQAFEDAQPEAKAKAKADEQSRNLIAEFEDVSLGDKALDDQNKVKAAAKAKTDREKAAKDREKDQEEARKDRAANQRQKDKAQRDKELSGGLGDDFIAAGQRRMLELGQMRGKEGKAARDAFAQQYQKAAFRKLAGSGVEPTRASELSADAVDFTGNDLKRQLKQLQAANGGEMAGPDLQAMLYDLLSQGGDGDGSVPGVVARGRAQGPRRGGGFRSVGVGPTGPVAAKPGGGGGGGDAVVDAVGRMANVVESGNQITAAHIQRIDGMIAQIARSLQRQGVQIGANARKAYQDGDTYLGNAF